jgi:hypothetical protein
VFVNQSKFWIGFLFSITFNSFKEEITMQTTQTNNAVIKTLPWGGEIYLEIPLHKKSANKFYARHGKNAEGREYIEFSKFGPMPNKEGERYLQKLRLFSAVQWVQLKHYVEGELARSIGWDMEDAVKMFEVKQKKETTEAQTTNK